MCTRCCAPLDDTVCPAVQTLPPGFEAGEVAEVLVKLWAAPLPPEGPLAVLLSTYTFALDPSR